MGGGGVVRWNLKSLVGYCLYSEFLMQFRRHGRTECDGCQKGVNSIALEHS